MNRPQRTRLRSLAVALVLTALGAAGATDIGVSPPRLELVARPGETLTAGIAVLTQATTEQRVAVEIGDWELSPDGQVLLLPAGSVETSASSWLEPEASSVVVPPNSQRDYRIAVTVPADAPVDGTYQAMVFFTVVPPDAERDGVGVVTTTRIGVAVYVTVAGTERPAAELVDLYRRDDASLTLVVANTGNTVLRLGGGIELRDEAGTVREVLQVPDVPVLRDSEREVTLRLPENLPDGFYVALALVEASHGELLVGELPLELP